MMKCNTVGSNLQHDILTKFRNSIVFLPDYFPIITHNIIFSFSRNTDMINVFANLSKSERR